nr:RHS repeat-associated core domain-containing protein [uncultured Desulfobacter sp.]
MSKIFYVTLISCLLFSISSIGWAETTQFGYDNLNQVTSVTYADGSTVSFSYDETGNRSVHGVTPATDTDGDGLSDYLENLAGTSAENADSDGDGLSDGEEDTNRNGWKDAGETTGLKPDTDSDGMNDGWEVTYSLDPLSDDSGLDPDEDGFTNLEEYTADSDPMDSTSTPSSVAPVPAVSPLGLSVTLLVLAVLGVKISARTKKSFLLIPFVLAIFFHGPGLVANAFGGNDSLPGFRQENAEPISPDESHRIISSSGASVRASAQEIIALDTAATSTDTIQAMARSLKNDADLIYEYVHDKITYSPVWGSIKGAEATLADGVGNSFDQSSLMIALLRASGYTANYKFGTLRLTWDEVKDWLGISTVDGLNILSNGGVSLKKWVYSGGDFAFADVGHVWVEVEIDGTAYVFDPSYKTHTVTAPIDFSTAMGYDRTAFLANAKSGAVEGTNYIQNVNKTNIANDLSAFTNSLHQEIKTTYPGATLEEITGGLVIIPADGILRQTSLPYDNNETIKETWTDIPNSYRTKFTVQHQGINIPLYTDETYGKRLSLFYNDSVQPVLTRDGTVLATGTAATANTSVDITIIVDHPYAASSGTYQDQTRTFSILAGGSYNIVNGWAETTRGMIENHRKLLNQYKADGQTDDSEEVLGETLAMMGFAWLAEVQMSDKLMDAMLKTHTTHHHVLGVCGQNQSPYIDLPMGAVSTLGLESDTAAGTASFFASSGRSSAMEWGVIEQFQPNSAVCTVKLLDIANQEGSKIFEANSSNWSSIETQLEANGYSANEIANVQAYVNAGYNVIVPHNGNLTQGDWQGIGFLAVSSAGNSIGHIISGGLSGGFADTVFDADSGETSSTADQGTSSATNDVSDEPIDLVTGDYLYDHSDLTLGNGAQPFAMAFARTYNSASRLTDSGLGLGWTHKYAVRATEDNDGFLGLGERSTIDAVAAMVEIYVTMDLLTQNRDLDTLVIASIGHRWFMDLLINNVVSVNIPGSTKRFVKLADGSFNAPPGDGSILTLETDGTYLVRTKHGVELDFNADGRMTAWTDANGNVLTFAYDTGGALQTISNGMGKALSLSYANDRISQVSDGTGRSVSYTYDTDGNLTQVTGTEGNTTVFEYDEPGRLTRIFYPDNPTSPFVTNTFDANDKVITQADANGQAWQYYISGYRTEEVNPLAQGNTAYYDKNGNAVRRIDPLDNETTLEYDGQKRVIKETKPEGNYTEYVYDDLHNPVTVTQYPKPGSTLGAIVNQFTYDATFSKVLTATDPLGRVTTFEYDSNGNLTRMEQPEVDGQIPVTLMTYNARGQVLTKTDPEGRITRYTYDGTTGELLSVVTDDTGLALTTQFTYDNVGNIQTQTDPEGHTTTLAYNGLRLPEQETGPAPFSYVTTYDYDEQGRLTQTKRQTNDTSQPWQTQTVTYTPTGKKYIVTDPEGNQTTHAYDEADRLSQITNAESQTTTYVYDDAGRLYQVIDAKSQTARQITYTASGLKETETDANGNTSQYTYDGFNRLYRTTYPDTSYESYAWDDVGNLTSRLTRAGQAISFTYDDLNRLASKILPGPETITYTYDLTGLQEGVTDSLGTISHTYDNALRLTGVTYPDGRALGYQYDGNSNRTRLTYPDNAYVTYTYDVLNRITDIKQAGTTLLAHYDYDALSRRTTLTYGNGTTTTYTYEIDNDLSSLALVHATGTATYTFITNNIGIRTQTDVDDYRFVYRQAGIVSTAYTPNNLNQYTVVGGLNPAYDGNGNLTSDGTNTYAYNAENRLVTAVTPDHTAAYVYDPMGRRIEKEVDSVTTRYLHDGNQVIVEYNSTGTELRRYIYGPGIDQPVCMITSSATYYYQFDGLGSVAALTDETGALQEIYAYNVFGQPNGTSYIGNPYLYTGRECDPETGLYYYRARYYNPTLGRFMQTDPIGYDDGMNLYAFCLNSPLLFIDPYGLSSLSRSLDWIQGGLDAIGIFDPTIVADGINAIISGFRGDAVGAVGSAISMLPFAGDLIGKGGKYGLKYGDEVVDVANKASKKVGSTRHVNLNNADNGAYMILLDDGTAYIGKGGTKRARQSARRVSKQQNSPVDDIAHWAEPDDASAFAKEAELIESVGGKDAPGLLNVRNSPGKN